MRTGDFQMLLVTMIWGINSIFVKDALGNFSPLQFNAVRLGLASALLLGLLVFGRGAKLPSGRDWALVILAGFLGCGLVVDYIFKLAGTGLFGHLGLGVFVHPMESGGKAERSRQNRHLSKSDAGVDRSFCVADARRVVELSQVPRRHCGLGGSLPCTVRSASEG